MSLDTPKAPDLESAAIDELLANLSRQGVSLWLDGDQLRYRAPAAFDRSLLDGIRALKADVIRHLRDARNDRIMPPLEARTHANPAPLSSSQMVWWSLSQIPMEHDWFPTMILRMRGPLDCDLLGRAVAQVVGRHEVLRTRFPTIEGEPRQVVGCTDDFTWEVVDLSAEGEVEAERRAAEMIDAEHARPFDITQELPVRLKILQVANQEFIFWLGIHHIAVDLASFRILSQEFRQDYLILSQGSPERVPPPPCQLSDFAVWEAEWLGPTEAHRRFWRQKVGALTPLRLPILQAPSAHEMCIEGALEVALPGDLHARMRAFARREGVTVSLVLLTAFQAALSHWVGQDDVMIGVWHRGRVPGSERLVGAFSRLRPAYLSLDGDPSFTQLIGQAKLNYAHTHDLRHTVTHDLVRGTRINRVMANFDRSPMVDRPKSSQFAPGIESEPYDPPPTAARQVAYELMLALAETPVGIRGTLRYAIDVIGREAAERLIETMGRFLDLAMAEPDASTKALLQGSATGPAAASFAS